MQNWLEGFVYRIELNWLFFAAAGSLPLSIAVLTVFLPGCCRSANGSCEKFEIGVD
jgi:hypothetical protein